MSDVWMLKEMCIYFTTTGRPPEGLIPSRRVLVFDSFLLDLFSIWSRFADVDSDSLLSRNEWKVGTELTNKKTTQKTSSSSISPVQLPRSSVRTQVWSSGGLKPEGELVRLPWFWWWYRLVNQLSYGFVVLFLLLWYCKWPECGGVFFFWLSLKQRFSCIIDEFWRFEAGRGCEAASFLSLLSLC